MVPLEIVVVKPKSKQRNGAGKRIDVFDDQLVFVIAFFWFIIQLFFGQTSFWHSTNHARKQ